MCSCCLPAVVEWISYQSKDNQITGNPPPPTQSVLLLRRLEEGCRLPHHEMQKDKTKIKQTKNTNNLKNNRTEVTQHVFRTSAILKIISCNVMTAMCVYVLLFLSLYPLWPVFRLWPCYWVHTHQQQDTWLTATPPASPTLIQVTAAPKKTFWLNICKPYHSFLFVDSKCWNTEWGFQACQILTETEKEEKENIPHLTRGKGSQRGRPSACSDSFLFI